MATVSIWQCYGLVSRLLQDESSCVLTPGNDIVNMTLKLLTHAAAGLTLPSQVPTAAQALVTSLAYPPASVRAAPSSSVLRFFRLHDQVRWAWQHVIVAARCGSLAQAKMQLSAARSLRQLPFFVLPTQPTQDHSGGGFSPLERSDPTSCQDCPIGASAMVQGM